MYSSYVSEASHYPAVWQSQTPHKSLDIIRRTLDIYRPAFGWRYSDLLRPMPKGLPLSRRTRSNRHVLAMTQERVLTLSAFARRWLTRNREVALPSSRVSAKAGFACAGPISNNKPSLIPALL